MFSRPPKAHALGDSNGSFRVLLLNMKPMVQIVNLKRLLIFFSVAYPSQTRHVRTAGLKPAEEISPHMGQRKEGKELHSNCLPSRARHWGLHGSQPVDNVANSLIYLDFRDFKARDSSLAITLNKLSRPDLQSIEGPDDASPQCGPTRLMIQAMAPKSPQSSRCLSRSSRVTLSGSVRRLASPWILGSS